MHIHAHTVTYTRTHAHAPGPSSFHTHTSLYFLCHTHAGSTKFVGFFVVALVGVGTAIELWYVTNSAHPLRFFGNSRTLMGCIDPLRRGVGAPHQCALESALPLYADLRLHIPVTHRNDAGTTYSGPELQRPRCCRYPPSPPTWLLASWA